MSQKRRDKKRNERLELKLNHVVSFLRFITAASGALFFISITGYILLQMGSASLIVMQLCIGINLFITLGAGVCSILLNKKDKAIEKMELNKTQYDEKDG